MRKPQTIERLYLDFDGFFAGVMQQAMPDLRGRPVGVIPFEVQNAKYTVVIACSKEAKAAGCQNVMPTGEALNDDAERQGWERITDAIDTLNRRFGKRMVTIGSWTPPPGGYSGGKIAYNRIPSAEDFL